MTKEWIAGAVLLSAAAGVLGLTKCRGDKTTAAASRSSGQGALASTPDSPSAPKDLPEPERRQSAPRPQIEKPKYPVATRVDGSPNLVKSPFSDGTVIDVGNLPPGGLARDPAEGKIFRIPEAAPTPQR